MHTIFEIKDTADKGLGVYATKPITPGTLILSEAPLMRIDKSYYMKSDIEEAISQLAPEQQAAYLSLSSAHAQDPTRYPRRGAHPDCTPQERQRITEQHEARVGKDATLLSIFMTNAMECEKGAAVFEIASRFNHSCVPNACFAWNEKLGVETVYAIKDIAAGEEITLSYVDPLYDVSARMWELWHYGFECDCPACGDTRVQGSFAARSRERRWRLREIDEMYYLDNKDKLRAKLEAVGLMKEEGIINPSLGQLYLEIARICEERNDFKMAVTAAEKALEVYTTCLGPDAERTESAVKSVRAFKKHLG